MWSCEVVLSFGQSLNSPPLLLEAGNLFCLERAPVNTSLYRTPFVSESSLSQTDPLDLSFPSPFLSALLRAEVSLCGRRDKKSSDTENVLNCYFEHWLGEETERAQMSHLTGKSGGRRVPETLSRGSSWEKLSFPS